VRGFPLAALKAKRTSTWPILHRKEDAAMNTNEENGGDEIISSVFSGDAILRRYGELVETASMTEEQARNFLKAIVDARKTNQET